jgi:hypothetical protein
MGDRGQLPVAQRQFRSHPGEDLARVRAGAVEDADFRRPGGEVVFAQAVEPQAPAVGVIDQPRGAGDASTHCPFERVQPRFGVLVDDQQGQRGEPDRHRRGEEERQRKAQPAQAGDRR